MGVRKFRSVEEMKRLAPRQPDETDLPRLLAGLWELGLRTRKRAPPPRGAHKYRSIEDAKARKDG